MKIIRNIIVAFSMYSKIPMPIFQWQEDDTKYAIAFLPFVGAIIGAVEYGLFILSQTITLPIFVRTMFWVSVPLLITGGFHLDGFMDVSDAHKSFKSKEEKLEILKDPHIGAFAVISLCVYGCLYLAFTYLLLEAGTVKYITVACIGFALVRAFGAFLSLVLKHAKQNGMLHEETKRTGKITKLILIVELLICAVTIACFDVIVLIVLCVVMPAYILWFNRFCDKQFGGIGGDAIGYFITKGELILMIVISVFSWVTL